MPVRIIIKRLHLDDRQIEQPATAYLASPKMLVLAAFSLLSLLLLPVVLQCS